MNLIKIVEIVFKPKRMKERQAETIFRQSYLSLMNKSISLIFLLFVQHSHFTFFFEQSSTWLEKIRKENESEEDLT